MSRIGNKPIKIPEKCEISLKDGVIYVKGPRGELHWRYPREINVEIKEGNIVVSRKGNSKKERAFHGLTRALINNMVIGTTQGFEKTLEVNWPGSKMKMEKDTLHIEMNYNVLDYKAPEGITIEIVRGNKIRVAGIDKQKVGEVAARIRAFMPPEPYKGKGIRYEGEYVKIKPGKVGA